MTYAEYTYSELAMGGVTSRGNVLNASDFKAALSKNTQAGCYRNHFKFTVDFQRYVAANNGSVRGYKGSCYTDYFWLDIDDAQELSKALDTAKVYINRLATEYGIPADHLRTFFSGKKGFHIGIPAEVFSLTASKELPAICKTLAKSLAGDLDYDAGVYDRTRLFRLNNTKHEGSGLYKVELHPKEILNCDNVQEILDVATAPRNLTRDYFPEDSFGLLDNLVKTGTPETLPVESDEAKEKWLSDLIDNGSKSPGRTAAVMRLGGYYKSKGIPEDVSFSLITAWDISKNTPPLTGDPDYPPDKIKKCVADAYKYPDGEDTTIDIDSDIKYHTCISVYKDAPAYVEKFSKNRLKFGYDRIDKDSGRLGKGEVGIILAYAGVGKTVLAQNIQMYNSQQGVSSIMFSLEMNAMRLYFRQLGIQWKMSSAEVEKTFLAGDGSTLVNEKTDAYSNMMVVDHVPMSVPLMSDCISQAPCEVGLVIVDHVGLLMDPGKEEYERMGNLSRDLVLMAKELDVAVLAVYQTNRTGNNGEIRLGMGRGSGMIEANCDIALGFWENENDPTHRHLKLLKARHGQSGVTIEMFFDGTSPRLIAY